MGNSLSTAFLPILLLAFLAMMFLTSRKQRRQVAETQLMQSNLAEGEVVTTTSGLRGTVVDASYEETIDLEIAPGVVTTWLRAAVRDKVNTDEPTEAEAESSDHDAEGTTEPAAGETPGGRPSA
ncbi:MAG TPA: preprotein translocase subunit YajC [Pseudonocardia sp.]|jgi:preprotein translocase subunit YajC|nr:preprotein translocase subunit YajC [Pseudonocardia sp.]